MFDCLFSPLPPGKGDDLAESSLSSIMAYIALVVGTVIPNLSLNDNIIPSFGDIHLQP